SSIVPGSYKAYVYGDNGASLTNNAVQNDDGYVKADTVNFQYPTLTADITVTQATPVITVLASQNATYTGGPYAGPVTCSAVGPNNESISATLTYAGTGGTIYASSSTPPTNAGTYNAVCSAGAGSATYASTSQSAGFTIGAAPSLTTVSCPAGVTYNGSAQTPCTATVTGIRGLTQTLTVTYTDNIKVGTATASASFAGDATHSGSSDSKTFQISKAAVTATAGSGSATYDGLTKSPSACLVTGGYTGDLTCANNP